MRISDCFVLFGLPHTASKSEVKSRYRELVKKYHPDTHLHSSSREQFEKVQHAYETIRAFFEFKESYTYEDVSVTDERLERIKRARKMQKEKRHREIVQLRTAISEFRNAPSFIVSKSIAIFACVLGFICLLDFVAPSSIEYEPIVNIQYVSNDYKGQGSLFIPNREISLHTRDLVVMQNTSFVLIDKTPFFNQITHIYIIANKRKVEIVYDSFYNSSVLLLVMLLFVGMYMFVRKKNTVHYYIIIKYYNLYVLPPIILYVLFGDNRINFALGLV